MTLGDTSSNEQTASPPVLYLFTTYVHSSGMVGLAPKWVRLVTNRTNLGLFKIGFNTFWLGNPKWTETDLKESMISHICANLKHFDAKPDIPG